MKKKKILYIHHGSGIGGASISLLYTIQQLNLSKYYPKVLFIHNSEVVNIFRENKIDTEIIRSCFYKKFYTYFLHSEAKYYKWYQINKMLKIFISWIVSALYLSPKILKKEKPGIVHLNSSVLTDWAFSSKRMNIKTIIHIREPIANGYLGLRKLILRKVINYSVDHIISISMDNANRINLPQKTTVIYNFINFNYFDKEIIGTLHNNNNNKYVIYLGGSQKIKGFYTLVKSLQYLNKGTTVLFVGYYPIVSLNSIKRKIRFHLSPNYKELITSLRIMREAINVIEVGVSTNIPSLIASSEAVLFPSIVPHFARPIIEAYAMGKPVIASDVDGMDEIVEHEKTGLIVEKRNPKALASAINLIISKSNVREKMSKNGFVKAKKMFNDQVNVNKIIQLYQ